MDIQAKFVIKMYTYAFVLIGPGNLFTRANKRQVVSNNIFSVKKHFLCFGDIEFIQYAIKYAYSGNISNSTQYSQIILYG